LRPPPRMRDDIVHAPPRGTPPTAPARFGRLPRPEEAPAEAPAKRAIASRERLYRLLLAYADALAAIGALFVAVTVLGDDRLRPASLLVMPLVVIASKLFGLYDRDELVLNKTTLEESAALFQLASVFTLVTWIADGIVVDGYLGNRQVLGMWVILYVMTLLGRSVARRVARRNSPVERCLLAGTPHAMAPVLASMRQSPRMNAEVVGHLSLETRVRDHGKVMRELEEAIAQHDVHRVILAPESTDSDEVLDLISLVKNLGVRVSVLPRMFDVVGTAVEFDTLNGVTVLGVRRFGLARSSRAIKRAMDIAGASLGLVAIGPLWLAISLAIRATSRGPVLFRQTRVGQDDGRRRRRDEGAPRRPQRGGRALQDHRRSAHHPRRALAAPHVARRAAAAAQRPARRDEPGGPAPARRRRGLQDRGPPPPPPPPHARHDGRLADPRLGADPTPRDGQDRLPLCRKLVVLGRREDPRADRALRLYRTGYVTIVASA
jgi:hypothetical protein